MLQWLFNHTDFITRDHCGLWAKWLIQTNQSSNMGIFIAYTFISFSLFVLWLNRRTTTMESFIFIGFFSFIFLCGTTHLCNVLAFYFPMYRLFTLIDFLTSTISLITAAFVGVMFTKLSRMPTLTDYTNAINELKHEKKNLFEIKKNLTFTVEKIKREKALLSVIIAATDTPDNIKTKLVEILNEKGVLSG